MRRATTQGIDRRRIARHLGIAHDGTIVGAITHDDPTSGSGGPMRMASAPGAAVVPE